MTSLHSLNNSDHFTIKNSNSNCVDRSLLAPHRACPPTFLVCAMPTIRPRESRKNFTKGDCRSLLWGGSASPHNKLPKPNLKRRAVFGLLFQRSSHLALCLGPVMTQHSQQWKHVMDKDNLLLRTGKRRDKA